jgi:uncharacterized protein (UPF0332 family)
MSVTPSDFLKSAEILAASGMDEICQRNAISRAYYAAYHRSCESIPPDGKSRGKGTHSSYIDQLNEADAGTLMRKVGVRLGAIYSGRITSDYRLEHEVRPKDYAMQICRTKELFSLLETPPSPATTNLTENINPQGRPRLRIVK